MSFAPTNRELNRLDFDVLLSQGRKALREETWEQAIFYLREAVRRAPMRQDLRELLALAVEGTLQNRSGEREAVPIASPQSASIEHHEDIEGVPPPSPVAFTSFPRPADSSQFRPKTHAPELSAASSPPRPRNFGQRHRRGPMSARLLGGVAGLLMIGLTAAMVWFYLENHFTGTAEKDTGPSNTIIKNVLHQARIYQQKGEYSQAIEKIKSLPPSPLRNHRLAAIFMDQGDVCLQREPPLLRGAIAAYREAVKYHPENADYGIALAWSYKILAKGKSNDAAEYERNLTLARQTLQAVLENDPENLKALKNLAEAAKNLRDQVLQAKCYQTIIDVDPDSDDARDARRDLESLGFRYKDKQQ